MLSDVEVDDAPSMAGQDELDEQLSSANIM
jgi:hypothetical protein